MPRFATALYKFNALCSRIYQDFRGSLRSWGILPGNRVGDKALP